MSQEKRETYDPNKYEHDYIIGVLENFASEIKTRGYKPTLIDSYACQLTAFMHGEIAKEMQIRELLTKKINK